jgi:general secretion pathway protein G
MHEPKDDSQGYSLVEMLIVLAIITTVAAIAIPSYSESVNTAKMVSAMGDIRRFQTAIDFHFATNGSYPNSLDEVNPEGRKDPWGQPYKYLNIAGGESNSNSNGKGKSSGKVNGCRKDKNLVPINSDYDLYSMGQDKDSQAPLTAKASRDDIIRANNGGFIGIAVNY